MRMRAAAAAVGAAVIVFAPVGALSGGDDYEAGAWAFRQGNYAEAHRLWLPLAEAGNAEAQNDLGIMYAEGKGVPLDFTEAVRWIRRAAEQGFGAAQFNLGVKHYRGRGVPQSYGEAAKWFRKAAGQGVVQAQQSLGVMYGMGRGVEKDDVRAYMWSELAASGGDVKAKAVRGILAERMTPARIAEAKRLAREWRPAGGR